MALPWVRLDSNIAGHDKILALLGDPSVKRWQAAASYVFALGWSGGQGTDGYIPTAALPHVHGTAATAKLLLAYGLWDSAIGGWQIHNYAHRQQMAATAEQVRLARRLGALKANCIRHHGPECGCWREAMGDTA
jgi:hypothetical protein